MLAAAEGQAAPRSSTKAPSMQILPMKTNVAHVSVDNLVVLVLVDTGACVSVMSDDFRRRLRKILTPVAPQRLRTVNLQPLPCLGVCTARLMLQSTIVPVQFVVLERCSYDVILGMDFLSAHGALIDCSSQELFLAPFPHTSFWEDNIVRGAHSGRLKLKQTTILPPQSTVCVLTTSDTYHDHDYTDMDIITEPASALLVQKGVTSPCSVTSLQGHNAKLWLVNTGYSPVLLPDGIVVASYSCTACPTDLAPVRIDQHPEVATASLDLAASKVADERLAKMIDKNLPLDQHAHILCVLKDYADIFDFDRKQGHTDLVRHPIDTQGHRPIRQKPYRVSHAERTVIQQHVQEMLDDGVIEESSSPWAAPVVLVRKKDGSWRFCIDFRKLNKITKRDTYPMPRIDDALDCLQGAQYFSSIDMRSGYWQIEVDPKDAEKTAFVTPDGLYQFRVMPFGLCNAPATFERMIDSVLGPLKWTSCLCYLDDIVVFGSTVEQHNARLRKVLKCMHAAGLTLNHKKCRFASQELTVLGHLVCPDGIRPDPKKTNAVTKFPRPTTIKAVRSFLGLCSYFRRFVKHFATKARPLHDLLKKGAIFRWEDEHETSFNCLKSALTSSPVLQHFDPEAPVEIHTDASGTGLGAVLTQRPDDAEHPVAFASRCMSAPEQNYSVTEQECLAVVWAINKFRPYLYGKPFKVVTDHHALCWLANIKAPSGKLARWALLLQEYDFEVVHKAGRKHLDADALSRAALPDIANITPSTDTIPLDLSDFPAEQRRDSSLRTIIEMLQSNTPLSRQEARRSRNFVLRDSVLYKKNFDPFGRPYLIVIPRHLRRILLQSLHDDPTSGHLGFARTYDRVVQRFFWPSMRRFISGYVRRCIACQRRKHLPSASQGMLQPIPPPAAPFHRLGIDLLGPFPVSADGNRWVVVCVDHYTRYAETKALPTATAPDVATFLLEQIILRHGAPRELLSDRGSSFLSTVVSELLRACSIHRLTTTAYHPQCNGATERLNRTLSDMLSMYVDASHTNWDTVLPFITYAYNTSRHDITSFSPFFLLFARSSDTTLDTLFPYVDVGHKTDYVTELMNRAEESRQLARTYTLISQSNQKARYDSAHTDPLYRLGDLVWVWKPDRKVGLSEKLMRRYFGPYEVIRQSSPVNYVIRAADSAKPRTRRASKEDVVHVSRMKPYHGPND